MARIVVCGAGTCGLITAMLFAKDGHDVEVIERDPMEPPEPADAWDAWERRGVNQFRLPHFLMSRFRYDMVRELPEVVDALVAAGSYELNFFGPFREVVPEPERFDVVTARRPVVEAAIAKVAAGAERVRIRRGAAIAGLTTGASARDGIVHVTGVRLEGGEEIAADLVVAATGRRSPLGRWLEEAGAPAPYESVEDSGFVYYGRYGRSPDGEQQLHGPTLGDFGSIGLLALPADDGTVGIGVIAASSDASMRKLRHEDAWQRVMRRLPNGEMLADLEPISDLTAMAGIEDRYRRFVVDGEPVATGAVAVADAWAATNPTLGRGISLGVMHALLLRDSVREHLDDPYALAVAWDDVTERVMTPWYEATIWHDRRKLQSYAAVAGAGVPVDDQDWERFLALARLTAGDLDLAVRWVSRFGFLLEPPQVLLEDPDLAAKLDAAVGENGVHEGPSREELLALVGA